MLALAEALAHAGVTARPIGPHDRSFERALFETARLDAPFLAQWPKDQRDAFLDQQFTFQDIHYRRHYPRADFLILECEDAPAGRFILDRDGPDWTIVDIALVPRSRGRGLGTAILRALQSLAADSAASSIRLQVEAGNRAQALYARLGFVETEDTGSHIAMVWTAS